jgi:hypothetical protein
MKLTPHHLFVGAVGGIFAVMLGGLVASLFWFM